MEPTPDPTPIRFTSSETARLAGVTYRQLDYWSRHRILPASIREADGSGSQRLYSAEDVIRARILGRLAQLGIHPRKIPEPTPADPAELLDWLLDELEALKTLTHPHLAMT